METYRLCVDLSYCQLKAQYEKLLWLNDRYFPGERVECPLGNCSEEFGTEQWKELKEHMNTAHFGEDPTEGTICKQCEWTHDGGDEELKSLSQWYAHLESYHSYKICYGKRMSGTFGDARAYSECKKKLFKKDEADHAQVHPNHAVYPKDTVKPIYREPPYVLGLIVLRTAVFYP